jgi:hypothetical protein
MKLSEVGERRPQLELADEVEQNLILYQKIRPVDLQPLAEQLRAPPILAGHTTDAQ